MGQELLDETTRYEAVVCDIDVVVARFADDIANFDVIRKTVKSPWR